MEGVRSPCSRRYKCTSESPVAAARSASRKPRSWRSCRSDAARARSVSSTYGACSAIRKRQFAKHLPPSQTAGTLPRHAVGKVLMSSNGGRPRRPRLLVTGGSGILGRQFIPRLIELGYEVQSLGLDSWPEAPCPHLVCDLNDLGQTIEMVRG